MSPFSQYLHDLRIRKGLRQAELANVLGYEQSYISALELGLKGPPTEEFIERLIQTLSIPQPDQSNLRAAAQASQRKLIIDPDAPTDIYWLLRDLRKEVSCLSPAQVRMIREIISLKGTITEEREEPVRRLKRRKKMEAEM